MGTWKRLAKIQEPEGKERKRRALHRTCCELPKSYQKHLKASRAEEERIFQVPICKLKSRRDEVWICFFQPVLLFHDSYFSKLTKFTHERRRKALHAEAAFLLPPSEPRPSPHPPPRREGVLPLQPRHKLQINLQIHAEAVGSRLGYEQFGSPPEWCFIKPRPLHPKDKKKKKNWEDC